MKDFVPPFFKDFGKSAGDILKQSKYDLKKAVEVNTKSSSGVKFTASGKLDEKASSGSVTVKSSVGRTDLSTEINMSGAMSTTCTSTKLVDGLKLVATVSSTSPSKAGAIVNLKEEANYSCNNVALTALFQSDHRFSSKDMKLDASAAFGYEGVSLGGSFLYKGNAIADYNAGAEYSEKDFTVTVKTSGKAEKITASYSHKVSPSSTAVAQFAYDLSKASPGKELAIGGSYALDGSSKISTMLLTSGNGATSCSSYETELNKNAKLTLSNIMDVTSTSIGGHKFGMKLVFLN